MKWRERMPWSVFLILSFKPAFSLYSSTRGCLVPLHFLPLVISSAYLRLLLFLPAILIPACNSSNKAFHMMCSAYKLNKQGDNKQPCCTPFSILNQSVVPYRALSVVSQPCIQVSQKTGKMVWYSCLLRFSTVCYAPHIQRFCGIVKETEINNFLELPCFLSDPENVGNLISGSSAFSKPSLNIWKFSVHVMLRSSSEVFEHWALPC